MMQPGRGPDASSLGFPLLAANENATLVDGARLAGRERFRSRDRRQIYPELMYSGLEQVVHADDEYMPEPSLNAVAMWIWDQVRNNGDLDRFEAGKRIRRLFGTEFVVEGEQDGSAEIIGPVVETLGWMTDEQIVYCPRLGVFTTSGGIEPATG